MGEVVMVGQLEKFKLLKNRILSDRNRTRADAVTLAWAEETLEAVLSVGPVGGFSVGEDGSFMVRSQPEVVAVSANDGSVPHVELDEDGSPVEDDSLDVVDDDLLVDPFEADAPSLAGNVTRVPDVDLPGDFPARALLIENGYFTVESVRMASDQALIDVKGIGPVLLRGIREALK